MMLDTFIKFKWNWCIPSRVIDQKSKVCCRWLLRRRGRRRRSHDTYVSSMLRRWHNKKTGYRCDEYLAILSMPEIMNKSFTCVRILYHCSHVWGFAAGSSYLRRGHTSSSLMWHILTIFIHTSEFINMRNVSTNFRPQNVLKLSIRNDKFTVQQDYLWIKLPP